jgi:hypothetical protein
MLILEFKKDDWLGDYLDMDNLTILIACVLIILIILMLLKRSHEKKISHQIETLIKPTAKDALFDVPKVETNKKWIDHLSKSGQVAKKLRDSTRKLSIEEQRLTLKKIQALEAQLKKIQEKKAKLKK